MSDSLITRYARLFGVEPAIAEELSTIEEELGVSLPSDFRSISTFYSGGILGGISHHAISCHGPATNIMAETQRLRASAELPHSCIVLAEPPGSLIVMNTNCSVHSPAVIWCDGLDASLLPDVPEMHKPRVWSRYSEFFRFLLDREERSHHHLRPLS
jgi:hypothetical protein